MAAEMMDFYVPLIKKLDDSGRKIPNLSGRRQIQGLSIAIENKAGSYRKWYDPHNKIEGKTKMSHDYGYIQKTMGVDGDKVDCYIGNDPQAPMVYVVHQMKAPDFKDFDEDKCMIGFSSAKEAKESYIKNFDDKRFFGDMTEMNMEDFKRKVYRTAKKPEMIKSASGSPKKKSPNSKKPSSDSKKKPTNSNAIEEEPVFEASKLDQAAVSNTFSGKKMKPGSTSLSALQRKSDRRTLAPSKYTRPPYEDE